MQLRDQFGNNCENANAAALDVKIAGKDDKGTSHVVNAAIKDNKNGTISTEYAPTLSGIYTIQAFVAVKGTLYDFQYLVYHSL